MKSIIAWLCLSSSALAQVEIPIVDIQTSGTRTPPYSSKIPTLAGSNFGLGVAPETLWPLGGRRPLPITDLTMSLVSTSADDDLLGIGARVVRVDCLDAAYLPMFELVAMDGTTPVPMSDSCLRIQSAFVGLVGSNGGQVGDITIENGGTTYDAILQDPAGNGLPGGHTRSATYTVPANRVMMFHRINVSTNDSMELTLIVHSPPFAPTSFVLDVNKSHVIDGLVFTLPGKTDIEFVGARSVGTAMGSVIVSMILVDDDDGIPSDGPSRQVGDP